ncbi:response regulator [Sporosalibacterium faouarense]|uniref:response regulator n=1 Tax=Sporosalibacterium faouarense TaxID=516123 RepID=UPI00141C3B33|nr:response regulator [Bacillota bacterium]
MIRVLIADDEHLSIDYLKLIIEKNIEDAEIIAIAKSGREAIEKSISHSPDIVFMDIKMPGINGIEAIKEIRKTNVNINFIITTAYEYFDYAKDAVNLGVYDYLLKPLNKVKLIDTFNNLKNLIEERRKSLQNEVLLREKMNKIIPRMESQFVYTHIVNERKIRDLDFYESIFDMKLYKGYIMVATLEEYKAKSKEENYHKNILMHEFYDLFNMTIKKYTHCLVGQPLLDRIIVYVPVEKELDEYLIRNIAIDIANKILKKINESLEGNYKIGIGRAYNIDNLLKSYNEAFTSTTLSSNNEITHIDDIVLNSEIDEYPLDKEKTMIKYFISRDIDGAIKVLEEIFTWMIINYKDDIDKIKSKLIELLIVIKRNIPYKINESDYKEQIFIMKLLKTKEVNELMPNFSTYIKQMLLDINNNREKQLEGIIIEAIEFIKENYNKNVSLRDVAKNLNMSYHYFSKFFKESIGKNFVDYVTDIRMSKAKELLENEDYSIKAISFDIGYNDPNYFSKIFKKYFGMSPTEFRQNSV